MNIIQKYGWHALLAVTIIALGKAGFELARVLLLEAQGAIDGDGLIFTVMGRAMLNGVVPYVDLFETKPPGVFLLMALSLIMTNGERLASFIQVAGFIAMAAIPGIICWKKCKENNEKPLVMYAFVGICTLIGILITLYAEQRGGTLFAEAFGSIFGALYAGTVAWNLDKNVTWKHVLAYSVLLLCCIGVKEPFLLSAFAVALVLSKNPIHFLKVFIVPLCIAAVTGLILLALLGLLGPYFNTYLPVMIFERAQAQSGDPLFLRIIAIDRIYGNLIPYYQAPIAGSLICALWVAMPLFRARVVLWKDTLLGIACIVLFNRTIVALYLMLLARSKVPLEYLSKVEGYDFVLMLITVQFPVLMALLTLLWFRSRRLLLWIGISIVALCIVSFATAAGAYYTDNHFGFPVPFFIALALLFAMHSGSGRRNTIVVGIIATLTLVAGIFYAEKPEHIQRLRDQVQANYSNTRDRTERLDNMLDACNVDRYIALWTFRDFAFTHHSPLGPMNLKMDFLSNDHSLYKKTYENYAKHGLVLVMQPDNWNNHPMTEFFRENFTKEPPPCARLYLPIEGYDVLFRKLKE